LQLKVKKVYEDLRENSGLCSKDVEELINDLQIYQAELEVQAEELIEKQHQLTESREKYFELYDLAPVGYVLMDKNCNILEANLTLTNLLGIEKSKLKNQKFIFFVAPDYRETLHTHCARLNESGQSQSCEIKLRGVDGNEFWVNMESAVEKNGVGNITGIRSTLADISEQKKRTELEHLLTSIMDNSPDTVTLQDFSGSIISWNKGAEDMYGYSRDEALKMKIEKIVPENKRTELNNLRVLLQAKGKIEELETKRLTKDGNIIDVWLSISDDDPYRNLIQNRPQKTALLVKLRQQALSFNILLFAPGNIPFNCQKSGRAAKRGTVNAD
jgi:PAS domain S-box-containing protein